MTMARRLVGIALVAPSVGSCSAFAPPRPTTSTTISGTDRSRSSPSSSSSSSSSIISTRALGDDYYLDNLSLPKYDDVKNAAGSKRPGSDGVKLPDVKLPEMQNVKLPNLPDIRLPDFDPSKLPKNPTSFSDIFDNLPIDTTAMKKERAEIEASIAAAQAEGEKIQKSIANSETSLKEKRAKLDDFVKKEKGLVEELMEKERQLDAEFMAQEERLKKEVNFEEQKIIAEIVEEEKKIKMEQGKLDDLRKQMETERLKLVEDKKIAEAKIATKKEELRIKEASLFENAKKAEDEIAKKKDELKKMEVALVKDAETTEKDIVKMKTDLKNAQAKLAARKTDLQNQGMRDLAYYLNDPEVQTAGAIGAAAIGATFVGAAAVRKGLSERDEVVGERRWDANMRRQQQNSQYGQNNQYGRQTNQYGQQQNQYGQQQNQYRQQTYGQQQSSQYGMQQNQYGQNNQRNQYGQQQNQYGQNTNQQRRAGQTGQQQAGAAPQFEPWKNALDTRKSNKSPFGGSRSGDQQTFSSPESRNNAYGTSSSLSRSSNTYDSNAYGMGTSNRNGAYDTRNGVSTNSAYGNNNRNGAYDARNGVSRNNLSREELDRRNGVSRNNNNNRNGAYDARNGVSRNGAYDTRNGVSRADNPYQQQSSTRSSSMYDTRTSSYQYPTAGQSPLSRDGRRVQGMPDVESDLSRRNGYNTNNKGWKAQRSQAGAKPKPKMKSLWGYQKRDNRSPQEQARDRAAASGIPYYSSGERVRTPYGPGTVLDTRPVQNLAVIELDQGGSTSYVNMDSIERLGGNNNSNNALPPARSPVGRRY